jgi:aldose 1-epimerase
MTPVNPTGEQYRISSGDSEAVVTEVGAGLRSFTAGGHDIVHGYAAEDECHSGRGQHLMPWPNRIRDGQYTFGGVDQKLALSEPERHNAIHGLARFTPFRLVEHTANRVEQTMRLFPQTGWSGVLDLSVVHTLGDNGLTVAVTATNVGATAAPFGYAAHPYFTVGESRVDEVSLSIPAAQRLEVDERLLPVALVPVAGTDYDCRDGSVVGARQFDTAFTDLSRDDDDRWRVRVRNGDRETIVWGDGSCGWIQVFTGDSLSAPLRRTSGIAIEPMTCGPDAFNDGITHAGMLTIEPDESIRLLWGIDANA